MCEETDNLNKSCWTECPDCDDYWCFIHNMHAADCTCRDLEWWDSYGMYPYETTVAQYRECLEQHPEAAATAEQEEEW